MDDQARGGPLPGEGNEPAGLPPVRAFFLLGAILAAVFAGFLATREESPATETVAPARSPDYSLTDAEAIAEFERLNAQLMQAYEDRNIALAEDVFTSDSPMLPRVRKEIRTLLGSDVLSLTRFKEISTVPTTNTPSLIVIERSEVLYPRFVTESGADASRSSRPERVRVEWELHVDLGRWLLHDAVVVKRQILRAGG